MPPLLAATLLLLLLPTVHLWKCTDENIAAALAASLASTAERTPLARECAPSPEALRKELDPHDVHSQLSDAAGEGRNPTVVPKGKFKYYLHDHGAFNFSSVVRCYEGALRLRSGGVDFDERVLPNVAEHLTDLWYLRAFQQADHPARTSEPSQAHVHVLGVTAFVSWTAAQLDGHPCGDLNGHYQRMRNVATALRESHNWRHRSGRDFVVVNSHFRGACSASSLRLYNSLPPPLPTQPPSSSATSSQRCSRPAR